MDSVDWVFSEVVVSGCFSTGLASLLGILLSISFFSGFFSTFFSSDFFSSCFFSTFGFGGSGLCFSLSSVSKTLLPGFSEVCFATKAIGTTWFLGSFFSN